MARQNHTFHSISNGYLTIYAFQFQCSKCICITTAFKRTNSEAHTYNNKMHERLSCTSLRFLYFSIKHARPPISSHFFLFSDQNVLILCQKLEFTIPISLKASHARQYSFLLKTLCTCT